MLQASTGKHFTLPCRHSNLLRGVLYTNMSLFGEDGVETVFGKLFPSSMRRHPNVISCEIIENIEHEGISPGVLHSNGIDIYLSDFADIISFSLNIICTPDADLASRLLSKQVKPGSPSPKKHLNRVYEDSIYIKPEEIEELKTFTSDLLGLRRKEYLLAIKAIRTYVTALHRLSENLDLSYTLLVMSIEALVQKFSTFESSWADIEDNKRKPIEKILEEVDQEISDRLKAAIVKNEHLALAKKFKHFILSNLPLNYFTDDASLLPQPIGRKDLESALQNLYKTRSKYVHELKALPKEFGKFSGEAETAVFDDEIILSFQGLTRLARAVIKEFITKQEKIQHESCDYNLENPNLSRLPFCPSMWISDTQRATKDNFSAYFSGFIGLTEKLYSDAPKGKLYDVRGVIEKGYSIKRQLSAQQFRSVLALCVVFSKLAKPEHTPKLDISDKEYDLINAPSAESLIAHAVLGCDTEWSVAEHEKEFENYYKKRFKKSGYRVSHKFEACLGLALAERYRVSGDNDRAEKQLHKAADDFPSIKSIREISLNFKSDTPLRWLEIIYPNIIYKPSQETLECNGL